MDDKLINNIDFLEERDLNICMEIIGKTCDIFDKHKLSLDECVFIMVKTFSSFYGTVLEKFVPKEMIDPYHESFKNIVIKKLDTMHDEVKELK